MKTYKIIFTFLSLGLFTAGYSQSNNPQSSTIKGNHAPDPEIARSAKVNAAIAAQKSAKSASPAPAAKTVTSGSGNAHHYAARSPKTGEAAYRKPVNNTSSQNGQSK